LLKRDFYEKHPAAKRVVTSADDVTSISY